VDVVAEAVAAMTAVGWKAPRGIAEELHAHGDGYELLLCGQMAIAWRW
jgi:hypothetical protein